MASRPASAPQSRVQSAVDLDLEALTEILRVARSFFGALADDTALVDLVDGHPVNATSPEPLEVTSTLVRQSLELTPRQARVIVPAGRAALFEDGMWTVSFVDAVTAAQGGGPGLVLYFVPTRTGWQVIPGALYGPRVIRQISFPTGWPESAPTPPA